jgi:hypothetical protein
METANFLNTLKLFPNKIENVALYEVLSSIYLGQIGTPPKIKGILVSFQPLKSKTNAIQLQIRGAKLLSKIEYAATREIKQSRAHKLLGRCNIIRHLQIEYLTQKTIHFLYKSVSKKTYGLSCSKFESLPKYKRHLINT